MTSSNAGASADRRGPRRAGQRGRLLVVSHPAVVSVNQVPYRELASRGWEVTIVVPDRWRAIGCRNGQQIFAEWGDLIPDPLPTGHSPLLEPAADGVDDDMRWMVNFEEAVKVGMGIRIQGFSQELDRGTTRGSSDPTLQHADRLHVEPGPLGKFCLCQTTQATELP